MKSFRITFRRWINGQMESVDKHARATAVDYAQACKLLRDELPQEIDISSVVEVK